jgi:hypothetical protein
VGYGACFYVWVFVGWVDLGSYFLILTLEQAAAVLQVHPETLRRKAKAGHIKGSKKAGDWRFLDTDIEESLRSDYPTPALRGKETKCSAKSGEVENGMYVSQTQRDDVYLNLLGQKSKKKPESLNKSSGRKSGDKAA